MCESLERDEQVRCQRPETKIGLKLCRETEGALRKNEGLPRSNG